MTYNNSENQFGFEDLEVYRAARSFRTRIYKLAKLLLPEEKFALRQQMSRAAVSLTNNIAEGHGQFNWQENSRFCRISRGSLLELVDDINVCIDEQYAQAEHLGDLKSDTLGVMRLLNGYLAYLQ